MSSSQLCDACYSCGMAFCSHDSTGLRLSCMVPNHHRHQVSDYISHPGPGMWLSSSSGHNPAAGLQEFQFFGHDNTSVDHRSLALPHHHTAMEEPANIKYQKNPPTNIPLTLDISSTTTTTTVTSLGSNGGSRPLDFPVTAQAPSSASAVSWGSILTDASTGGRAKEVNNKAITGQGESSTDREAKILRYREKKAMRNFEKQVRYESRKKYAEIRPRVRGRFAKNSNSDQPSATPEYNSSSHYGTGWFSLSP